MSECSCSNNNSGHVCDTKNTGVQQTLDEMDFEKGLWYAAQHGDLDRLDKLLVKGEFVDKQDSAGYTALHYAARNGQTSACTKLLQGGANINATTRAGGATSLQRACAFGRLETVQLLLERHANVTLTDTDGRTCLHRAAESGNVAICILLLAQCCELKKVIDNKGKLAFDYCKNGEVAELLKVTD